MGPAVAAALSGVNWNLVWPPVLMIFGLLIFSSLAGSGLRKERVMPYQRNSELPREQTGRYDEHQKDAFRKAFNSAYSKYGGDEGRAFATTQPPSARERRSTPRALDGPTRQMGDTHCCGRNAAAG